jgi:hypothetical protein
MAAPPAPLPIAVPELFRRARVLADVLRDHGDAIAAAAEPCLFPDGVPVPLKLEELEEAKARAWERMIEKAAGLTARAAQTLESAHLGPLDSGMELRLLIQSGSEDMARAATVPAAIRAHAAKKVARMEALCFPGGCDRWMGVGDLLRDQRRVLVAEIAYVEAELAINPEEEDDPELQREWVSDCLRTLHGMVRSGTVIVMGLLMGEIDPALRQEILAAMKMAAGIRPRTRVRPPGRDRAPTRGES